MKRKIIILLNRELRSDDFLKFGEEYYKNFNIEFEIWTFAYFRKKKINDLNKTKFQQKKIKNFEIINSFKDLKTRVEKNNKNRKLIFLDNNNILSFNFLRKYFNNKKLVYGKINLSPIPTKSIKFFEKLNISLKVFINNPIIKLFNYLDRIKNFFLIKYSNSYIYNYSFILISGSKSSLKHANTNTKIIYAFSYDYLKYINMKHNTKFELPYKNYTVFIDEGNYDHPDFKLLNIKPYVAKDIFFNEINLFFNWYEKKYNTNIVVAGHPRLKYDSNLYSKRLLIKNDTLNLVKNCDNVLIQMSTAASFAVLFNKPITHIISDNHDYKLINRVLAFHLELESNLINISRELNADIKFNFSNQKYNNYISKYLKHKNSKQSNLWDIFMDSFLKNNL